jgi:hypothetical protein
MSLRSAGERNTARLFEDGLTVPTRTSKMIVPGKLKKRPKALHLYKQRNIVLHEYGTQ